MTPDKEHNALADRLEAVRKEHDRLASWNRGKDRPARVALHHDASLAIRDAIKDVRALQAAERERDEAREALKPFAAFADFEVALAELWPSGPSHPDGDGVLVWSGGFGLKGPRFTYGDIRKARSVLTGEKGV